jgi:hypothetical protein
VFSDTCAAAAEREGSVSGMVALLDGASTDGDSGERCNEARGFAVRSPHGADTPDG